MNDQEAIRDAIRAFVTNEINPYVDQWEKDHKWPAHEICRKAGALGYLGINRPPEYGGMGLDLDAALIWASELGRIPAYGVSSALTMTSLMATPALARYGSDQLRDEYLTPTVQGAYVACLGASEAGGGSDVANIKTTAVKKGGDYIINGSKMWITNAIQADWCCLVCNTSAENAPHKNKSLIIVPLDIPGVHISPPISKMGGWSSDTAEIFFDNVRVPVSNRIGDEGMGFMYQMEQFSEERLTIGARTAPQLQQCINATLQYVSERVAFGKPLLDNQWIQFKLAEYQAEVVALTALTDYATKAYVADARESRTFVSSVKLKAGELARTIPDGCLQFWGGSGYVADSLINRLFRDTRLISIGGGATEIMLQVISKEMRKGVT